jgi:hypothetical protein
LLLSATAVTPGHDTGIVKSIEKVSITAGKDIENEIIFE